MSVSFRPRKYAPRKGGATKSVSSASDIRKLVLSDHKKLSVLAKEAKANTTYLDSVIASSMSSTAVLVQLSGVAQGTGVSQRIGNFTEAISNEIRYQITAGAGVSIPSGTSRVIIFKYNSGLAGASPSAATILDTPTNVLSNYNDVYKHDYTVLYDKMHAHATAVSNVATNIHKKMKVRGTLTFYSSSNSNWDKNSIWILLLSDQNTYLPTFSGMNRFRYSV